MSASVATTLVTTDPGELFSRITASSLVVKTGRWSLMSVTMTCTRTLEDCGGVPLSTRVIVRLYESCVSLSRDLTRVRMPVKLLTPSTTRTEKNGETASSPSVILTELNPLLTASTSASLPINSKTASDWPRSGTSTPSLMFTEYMGCSAKGGLSLASSRISTKGIVSLIRVEMCGPWSVATKVAVTRRYDSRSSTPATNTSPVCGLTPNVPGCVIFAKLYSIIPAGRGKSASVAVMVRSVVFISVASETVTMTPGLSDGLITGG